MNTATPRSAAVAATTRALRAQALSEDPPRITLEPLSAGTEAVIVGDGQQLSQLVTGTREQKRRTFTVDVANLEPCRSRSQHG